MFCVMEVIDGSLHIMLPTCAHSIPGFLQSQRMNETNVKCGYEFINQHINII